MIAPWLRRDKTKSGRLTPDPERDRQNRQTMLQLVHNTWIEGVLEQSLYTEVLIDLGLEARKEAVGRPWDVVLQMPGQANQPLPPGTKVIDIFDNVGQSLLILGEPGSGKTTQMLDLARDLIRRAEADAGQPIPVVFNLSSWAEQRQPIATWLLDELRIRYNIPTRVGQMWIDDEALLLLLDGLDEVTLERREECVAAINDFLENSNKILPLVVCSRTADYDLLESRLNLQEAIALQPLTPEQIDRYLSGLNEGNSAPDSKIVEKTRALVAETFSDGEALIRFLYDTPELSPVYDRMTGETDKAAFITLLLDHAHRSGRMERLLGLLKERNPDGYARHNPDDDTAGPKPVDELGAVRSTLSEDDNLRTLAQSPLMLSIMVLAYRGKSVQDLGQLDTLAARRKHLFDAYVAATFDRRRGSQHYPKEQTTCWLGWLAQTMAQNSLTVFSLEGMQPGWLPDRRRKRFRLSFGLSLGLLGGLIVGLLGGLSFGLLGGVVVGLSSGLSYGLFFGLFFGLAGGLILGLSGGLILWAAENMRPIDNLAWSWPEFKSGLGVGLLSGLVIGLVGGLILGLVYRLIVGLSFGLSAGLIFGLGVGLSSGLSARETVQQRAVSNQGIRQSAKNYLKFMLIFGLMVGLSGGLIFGLLYGLPYGLIFGLLFGLFVGLIFGLSGGLNKGGAAFTRHYLLRFMLYRDDYIPWNYVRFLDYAAERILLRKVGGSYIFIHRMLLEYFAEMWDEGQKSAWG